MSQEIANRYFTVHDFGEYNRSANINSPRSLRACAEEGVSPLDLVYKTLDAFADKGLSPRLVKLRYDFHEAKRKDLLFATRRSRDRLVDEQERKGKKANLEKIADKSGLDKGHLMALQGDTLKRERLKFLRAQQVQREWLRNTLQTELTRLEELENNNEALAKADDDVEKKLKEAAQRKKELNDKDREFQEQKRLEKLAQEKYEKQMAKAEFERQMEEIEKMKIKQKEEERAKHERNLAEAARQKEREEEMEIKREAEAEAYAAEVERLYENDMARLEVLNKQKCDHEVTVATKRLARENKLAISNRNLAAVDQKKRDDFEDKQNREMERDERLAHEKALVLEEGAKKSFHLMMKRKQIQDESIRLMEDKRRALTEERMATEKRLMLHEQKKQRYLEFKRELDSLKERNKEINVMRQRRKEEFSRSSCEENSDLKKAKTEAIIKEKKNLWNLRRSIAVTSSSAREEVRDKIIEMKVKSAIKPKEMESDMNRILSKEIFSPAILHTSLSVPGLRLSALTTVEESQKE